MLTLYRSNRAEFLAALLARQLKEECPGPMETVEVMVNTWPTSRWLGEQLAAANGISSLVRFPFPGSRLRQLVRLVLQLPAEEDDKDPPLLRRKSSSGRRRTTRSTTRS